MTALHPLRETDPTRRVILALDLPDQDRALRLADQLRPELAWVKVGLQLFGAEGPDLVRRLVSMGLHVFVDLKLHDIPNTVGSAVESLSAIGAELATVHTSAGTVALRAGAEAARRSATSGPRGSRTALLGVTVLTSFDAAGLGEVLGRDADPSVEVARLARLGIDAGLDGLVASPHEVAALRRTVGHEPLLVIPGIRPAGAESQDQSRVATPARAIADGADFLVIGRPITRADVPRDALRAILDEVAGAQ
ncbi:MAG TPA: orotidine-5'-phosphate decarboxylase [Candidatus Krumholzibacteria bacterium]|nr:orotidine-5'-phosphate decarboxylase [Candidatus Krumholzibacteria bacterium]